MRRAALHAEVAEGDHGGVGGRGGPLGEVDLGRGAGGGLWACRLFETMSKMPALARSAKRMVSKVLLVGGGVGVGAGGLEVGGGDADAVGAGAGLEVEPVLRVQAAVRAEARAASDGEALQRRAAKMQRFCDGCDADASFMNRVQIVVDAVERLR